MKTQRLFDKDAFQKEFEASVLSCQPEKGGFAVVLDKTAFFPEGGGQSADKGTIQGVPVTDVQQEGDVIVHYLETAVSGTVKGVIDWDTRFERMQNHSGEHVVSGILHRLTGADNISFSLTDSETTLAFNKPLSEDILQEAECLANAAVFADVPVVAWYPSVEELATTQYRSKLDLTEDVRLVRIEGIDLCACCAPHCRSTGQIGLIKIINSESYKGGTKIWIVCGSRTLAHHEMLLTQAKHISHLLCAKLERLAPAVETCKAAKEQAEYALVALRRKAVADKAAAVEAYTGNYFGVCEFKGDDLRAFAEALKEKIGGLIVVLEGEEGNGYRYVITSKNREIDATVKAANSTLHGRGGGRDNMARGSFGASLEEIKAYFDSLH